MSNLKLTIRLSNGDRFEIDVASDATVPQCKEHIARTKADLPANRQRLVYKGRILDDDRALTDYGVVDNATLFLVMSSSSTAPPSSPGPTPQTFRTTTPGTPSTNGTTQSRPAPAPAPMQSPFANPFMNSMGSEPPSPDQMQQMLNSPMMQGLMENPELMRNVMQSSMRNNPQIQRVMEQNPELQQMWNDPAVLNQAIQMMRNPSAMQQAMRQQDLAMSQLENLPGGFSALSSMYRNIQEPLMEAQDNARGSSSSSVTSPGNSVNGAAGATGTAMPNPWGPSPSANNNRGGGNSGGMPNPWSVPSNPTSSDSGSNNNFNAPGNLWGAGGMPTLPRSPQDMEQMLQLLENPMIAQMMDNMVQNNPDMLRSMMEQQNPMMRQLFQSNPQLANDMIRQIMNPQSLRQMMQLQQQMQGMGIMPPGGMGMMGAQPQSQQQAGGGLDFTNLLGQRSPSQQTPLDFGSLMQQFQGMNTSSNNSNANPADRYRAQLQSLRDMGFDDEPAALAALHANHGNLNRAVDQLLMGPSPAQSPATPAAAAAPPQQQRQTDSDASTPSEPKNPNEKKND